MARRILVAIDSRELGARLLDVAARLAAGRKAELIGLYVEETEFLNAANLPFTKVFSPSGGGWQALEPHAMERALRSRASELQQELERLAVRWELPWSFRTERGGPGEHVIAAAGGAELVVLGRSNRGGPARLGRTARRAVAECHVPVLVLGPDAELPVRVTAFYAGGEDVLEAARELSAVFARPLAVAVLADDTETADRLKKQAMAWLQERKLNAAMQVVNPNDRHALNLALSGRSPGLSVVPAGGGEGGTDLDALLDVLEGPVLVIRS
ncbi:universal stress protein [Ferruginivarius sediminum]|uniref:Universal stress protein n=1 Tax=Ferruginivarius sediminum TaxID=2661937 RepID=A0A369TF03_9PROT|nr:universal stress protein [Ferruginivarius sediminum]RDD62697.1 universal stress protein [Ferruginivarius sediminum]